MAWIGRKKIAFIPVFRPNAHPPDVIPADWNSDILRRVLFDPDTKTGVDRSLRAYIHTTSSGRADLDVVVMPMATIDLQDVRLEILDERLDGPGLRNQGFDAAAIVMLGGVGAGTAQKGGFWARFVMAEKLGTWAMELMHVLTGFDDIRCQPGFVDCPNDLGDIGFFDEMAFAGGTHPSAYTKAAIGWLDSSAIALHANHTKAVSYALHAVGLVQPPPTSRSTAVRIGSQVPYLMVEARLMVDQFESASHLESGILSQGVIVYRVQTSSPHGSSENNHIPVLLLTPTALKVGQSFAAGDVRVKVLNSLPGGFSISVDDSLKAIGFVTSYESERADPDRPPGPNNPLLQTIEIDSKPGFIFTATGGPSFAATVKNAQEHHRKVEITYTSTAPNSGRIVSVKLK